MTAARTRLSGLYGACLGMAMTATLVPASPALAQPAHPAHSARTASVGDGCSAADAPKTVEEQRLSSEVPKKILARSGFDRFATQLGSSLCGVTRLADAERLVTDHGRALWKAAVDRAQGRGPDGGDLPRGDDRPLYWARLGMTKALRAWTPGFPLGDADRAALLGRLERASRGQDSISFPGGTGIKRVVVTGFDPFQLDFEIRRGNPAGANALALDGTTVNTAAGPARIETAMFPVRWADFTAGTVETTLLPHLTAGPAKADLLVTVSQGRPGQFDLERWNGAWRGGSPDNLWVGETGTIPVPPNVPTIVPQPQFVPTTLPYKAILAAGVGPFPVLDRTTVTEIPAGGGTPVERTDGPTPGSTARAGGGGDYLSNEIAYRATLLRDAVRARIPAGHVHTPVLLFGPDNTAEITDPTFERNRREIVDQTRRIVIVAAGAPAEHR